MPKNMRIEGKELLIVRNLKDSIMKIKLHTLTNMCTLERNELNVGLNEADQVLPFF